MERGVTFPTRLVANHNALCHLANQQSITEQTVRVGRRDFVENKAFERGGAWRNYNNVQYLKNYVFF